MRRQLRTAKIAELIGLMGGSVNPNPEKQKSTSTKVL
jgi:hypothetical protein